LMPGLVKAVNCYHTKLVTTSPKGRMPDVQHIEFHEDKAVDIAKEILEVAIDNFKNRVQEKVYAMIHWHSTTVSAQTIFIDRISCVSQNPQDVP
ncbi:hypothetical protein LCGC14_2448270, partial [marine sediment metagenome]